MTSIETLDDEKYSLYDLVRGDNIEHIQQALDDGLDIEAIDELGNTMLHHASYRGQLAVGKFLLSKGT